MPLVKEEGILFVTGQQTWQISLDDNGVFLKKACRTVAASWGDGQNVIETETCVANTFFTA